MLGQRRAVADGIDGAPTIVPAHAWVLGVELQAVKRPRHSGGLQTPPPPPHPECTHATGWGRDWGEKMAFW